LQQILKEVAFAETTLNFLPTILLAMSVMLLNSRLKLANAQRNAQLSVRQVNRTLPADVLATMVSVWTAQTLLALLAPPIRLPLLQATMLVNAFLAARVNSSSSRTSASLSAQLLRSALLDQTIPRQLAL